MKSVMLIGAVFSLFTTVAWANPVSREALIQKIEGEYSSTTFFSPDSPLVQTLLAPAKSVNPGVSNAVWQGIAKEIAPALGRAVNGKGGVMDSVLRTPLETLSDSDLQRLMVILSDPVYKKFQTAITSPAAQRRVVQSMMANAWKLNVVVDQALTEHKLNVPH
ncbi:MAG: hypothetical protein M0T84_11240 [Betaproteobacteria bacterium]|nr:hypothetical protein [Betaproteobacteria bacterium]